jgi:hypothetical protein
MGLSIYYTGMLRDKNHIEALINEAAEIADNHHWDYSELPHVPDIPIRGLIVQPENCDPVWLTFHEDGYLCSPILYSYLKENPNEELTENTKQVMVTKTQYAGADTHMLLINFLHYLDKKYFSRFELTDESKFWETGDEEYCRKRFGEGERIKELIELALDTYQTKPEDAKEIYKHVKAELRQVLGIPKKKL